jgi:hypothetical protein
LYSFFGKRLSKRFSIGFGVAADDITAPFEVKSKKAKVKSQCSRLHLLLTFYLRSVIYRTDKADVSLYPHAFNESAKRTARYGWWATMGAPFMTDGRLPSLTLKPITR